MALHEDILNAREAREGILRRLAEQGGAVLCIRANVPGADKATKAARYVVGRFAAMLLADATDIVALDGADGPTMVARFATRTAEDLKAIAMRAENATPLGRLADLDVYGTDGNALTRGALRPCYLCGEPAAVCARTGKHPVAALLKAMDDIVRADAILFASGLIEAAIQTELDLEPKFGLVTKTSRGSHPDMDYALMKQAKAAIVPHLAGMFALALDDDAPAAIFAKARTLGLSAERAMYTVTGGINAYKGLIFSMGLAAAAAGKVVFGGMTFEDVYEFVARMAEPLLGELDRRELGTFGRKAWAENRIGGARMEAARGFPSVRAAVATLDPIRTDTLHRTLCRLIATVEDTVLLKRAGTKARYDEVRRRFAGITDFSKENMVRVTAECIAAKLSFGGSADLLATAVFLRRLQTAFRFNA